MELIPEQEREEQPEHENNGSPEARATWPVSGGEMAALIREKDWSKTPLSPIEEWPQSLKTTVDICLGSNVPIGIYWGSDLVLIYNDAWRMLVGKRHPSALGRPARDVFPEIWDTVEPMFAQVLSTGEATGSRDQARPLNGDGSMEEGPLNLHYALSPIRGKDGSVEGIFNIASDVPERLRAEEALRASEERLRLALEAGELGAWELDLEMKDSPVRSPRHDRIFGYEKPIEDWNFETFVDHVHPDDRASVEQSFEEAFRTGEWTFECRIIRADDALRWIAAQGKFYYNGARKPVRAVGIIQDITERKEAEVALAKVTAEAERQSRLYETIIRSTPDLVYVIDLDYRFTFVNDALLHMWGRTREESIGKSLLDIGYEPWHAEMHEREIDQVVATKQPIRGEVPFPHATLGKRIYDYIFVPVLNAEGDVEAIAGTTRDITERRQTEDALRESEERYRALVTASSDVVYRMSPDWSEMHQLDGRGFVADTVKSSPTWLQDYIHPDDQPRVMEAINEAVRTKSIFELEHRVRRVDGTLGWTFSRAIPLMDADGEITEWFGTASDVTERKRAEETLKDLNETLEERVRERTEQVRELASTLTMAEQEERRRISQILHDDLQQLLYGIQLKMTYVRRGAEATGEEKLLSNTQQAYAWVDTAISTTRQLTVDLSPPVLDDEGLADALQWLQRQMAELHHLEIELEAEHAFYIPDEDMRVLLFQIVRELLFNVVKHAETDRATVALREEEGRLVIHVTDEGRGFDVEAAEEKRARDGGFGLFSVRERLGLFGGRMEITSRPSEGTHVRVYAPVSARER